MFLHCLVALLDGAKLTNVFGSKGKIYLSQINHRLLVFLHSLVAELTGGKDAHRLQRKISEIKSWGER